MHVIIAGGGRTGRNLVNRFRDRRISVTVIDSDPRKCERISESFPYVDIVLGDAIHPRTLREVIVQKTRAFIAVTGQDHFNLLASALASRLGIERVILKLLDPEYRALAEIMELNDILDPADSFAAQVVARLDDVDFAELVHQCHPNLRMKRFSVDGDSDLAGIAPLDLAERVGKKVYPVLLLRDGAYALPSDVDTVKEGDEILAWHRKH